MSTDSLHTVSSEIPLSGEHLGPHIPQIQGETIAGWNIFGIPITNVMFSTWILLGIIIILVILFRVALSSKRFPRIR